MKTFLKISEAAENYKISKGALCKAVQKKELNNYSNNNRMHLLDPPEIEQWIKTANIRRRTKYKVVFTHKGKEITEQELIELLKKVKW